MRKKTEFDLSFATFADIDDVLDLLYPAYFEESTYADLEYDPQMAKETVISWLQGAFVLARVDGELAGVASMYFTRTFYKQIEGDVVMFYVHPDYRGTGIGRSLAGAIDAISQKNNAAVVYTTSGSGMKNKNNSTYINLFKKFGFKPLGTELIKKNV